MRISFHLDLDDRVVKLAKAVHRHRLPVLTFVLGAGMSSLIVYAAVVSKPFTFTDGQVVSSAQINSNFDTLYTEVNAKETRINTLEAASWTKGPGGLYTNEAKVGVGQTSPLARFDVNGSVRVANDSTPCSSAFAGAIRYNGTLFQGCNGVEWVQLDNVRLGSGLSASEAGSSCKTIKTDYPSSTSGVFWIDPDGSTSTISPYTVYCDMSTDGGGWTFVATVTNFGDGANQGSWLQTTPTPNRWESSDSFGTLDPNVNADFRSAAFHQVAGTAVMITHRNLFLLRTNNTCLASVTLKARFAGLGWTCTGSQDLTTAPACTNACTIAASTPRTGDTALLNGVARTYLFFKAGEADGAQDTNKDRAYLSTSYRDNVDYPTGLGAFCSGSSCSPRTGEADVNDRADAIVPTVGTEFYGIWVR